MKKVKAGFILIVLSLVLLQGCKSEEMLTELEQPAAEPVTIALDGWNFSKTVFIENRIAERVAEALPHIRLEHMEIRGRFESGNPFGPIIQIPVEKRPDILYVQHAAGLDNLQEHKLHYDLSELVRSQAIDLSKIDKSIYEEVLSYGSGELLGFPYMRGNIFVTFYNEDLFRQFDVPVPRDGMTWEETIQLADRFLSAPEPYRGIAMDHHSSMPAQMGLTFFHSETGAPTLSNPAWRDVLAVWQDLTAHIEVKFSSSYTVRRDFITSGTIALSPAGYTHYSDLYTREIQFNWDMVSYPAFAQNGMAGLNPTYSLLTINPDSPHKQEAFQVLSHMSSEEFQMENSRNGHITVLSDPSVQAEYGANLSALQGKNIGALFYGTPLRRISNPYQELEMQMHEAARPIFQAFVDGELTMDQAQEELEAEAVRVRAQQGE